MKIFNKVLKLVKQYKKQLAILALVIGGALGYAYIMGLFKITFFVTDFNLNFSANR